VLYSTFVIVFFLRDEVQFNFFYGRLFERLFISILAALIILEQCYCENSLFKFSSSKYLTRLGVISYGLYCLHFIGILIAINIFKIIMPVQNYLQVFVLVPLFSLALTICIAYLSYTFFESPFLKLKKQLEK
jgi:peptidoglycan/LPS O-acetylase OafA/YrhL